MNTNAMRNPQRRAGHTMTLLIAIVFVTGAAAVGGCTMLPAGGPWTTNDAEIHRGISGATRSSPDDGQGSDSRS